MGHGDRLSSEDDPVSGATHTDDATARRCLLAQEHVPAEALASVAGQRAVSRPGHRVLGDAGVRSEHPAHAVDIGPVTRRGDDDSTSAKLAQLDQIRAKAS